VVDMSLLRSLPRISLADVLATAPATTRVDRKHLVTGACADAFLAGLPAGLRLLSIGSRLDTSYRSTYFDTADLLTCRAHIQGRRRRWKARSRLYVEDGLCRLELKVRDGSGLTHKVFEPTTTEAYGQLSESAATFFRTQFLAHGMPAGPVLMPALEVTYRRVTLADPGTGSRVTIDVGVRATRGEQAVDLDPDHVMVETKGGRAPGAADHLLRRLGARPGPFSKYVASASVMDHRIPDNDVRHLLGRQLHLTGGDRENLRRTA
jgi:hypothetical protein